MSSAMYAGSPTGTPARTSATCAANNGYGMDMNKDMRKLLREAVKLGATLEQGRKHIKVRCPNGRMIVVASTPSEHRAVMNARARLQRQGELPL